MSQPGWIGINFLSVLNFKSMKLLKHIASMALLLTIASCSSYDEPVYQAPDETLDGDSITIPISLSMSDLTRAQDGSYRISNWERYSLKNNVSSDDVLDTDKWTWSPFYVHRYISDAEALVKLSGRVYCPVSGKVITWNKQNKTFNPNVTSNTWSFNLTLPKKEFTSDTKVEFMLTQGPFNSSSTNAITRTWYNQDFCSLNMVTPEEFRSGRKQILGESVSFPIDSYAESDGSTFSELNNRIVCPFDFNSYYTNEKLLNASGDAKTSFKLKDMYAYVIVMTDEFQDYMWPRLTNVHQVAFDGLHPRFFTFLDFKDNRKLHDYIPGFDESKFDGYLGAVHDAGVYYDYSLPIINAETNEQYNLVKEHSVTLVSNMPLLRSVYLESIEMIDIPVMNVGSGNAVYRKGGVDNYYTPVAQRCIPMCVGDYPKTMPQASSSFKTHINKRTDLDKSLDRLVVTAYNDNTDRTGLPKFMRAVIAVPEGGFKPGNVYVITNKSGTKMFKEWDEDNGTTRAESEDYTVDPSNIVIEEYKL